jgi:carbon-monoxide dehydrogenase large subunit
MADKLFVGRPIPRIDAAEKVTGQALFGDDLRLPNILYAKALRSPHPHAKILNIDTSNARRLKGVRAIATGKDLPVLGGEALMDYPFLALDKVRYVGEPVVAVAADDEDIAETALNLIKVEYEPLPALFDPLRAMQKDAPLIHEDLSTYICLPVINVVENSNICNHISFVKGDVTKGFDESDYIFEDTFTTQMVSHAALEPHMAIAQVSSQGDITVWVTNDGPHRLRNDLANALGIPLKKIRIISPPYMGGGFGGKGGLKAETVCIALALKTNGRPVKMVLTRDEVFSSTSVRHPSVVQIKTGVKTDGRLWARQVKVIYDTGAYSEKGPTVCLQASTAAPGPYRIPHIKVDGYCVYTNKAIAGAYRGYGIPQAAWAHESQMDIIAEKLKISPVEIRLMNAVEEGDIAPTGQQTLYSVGLKDCIRKVADNVDWDKPRKKYHGRGIACAFKNTKTPSGSSAIVKVSKDGSVEVLVSTVEIGQGARTIIAQMTAEELKVPIVNISVSTPDTSFTPYDASTTSSRSTFHMGNAVKAAAGDARKQILQIASRAFGVEAEECRLNSSSICLKDDPGRTLSFADVIRNECRAGIDIIGRGSYHPDDEGECGGPWSAPSIFWMYGAHIADIEIDAETGEIRVFRIIGAHDLGKAINPVNCEGQIEGGIVHGISTTLFEDMVIGDNGEVVNSNFTDYKLATACDIPEIVPIFVEKSHKEGPWGAKGIGEMPNTPIAPAIANAIYDAIGVRIKDLPITREKVLTALKAKTGKNGSGLK